MRPGAGGFHVGMFPGDTHAGWRRTAEAATAAWPCRCVDVSVDVARQMVFEPVPRLNPPYRINCPRCFERRPGC